MVIIFFMVAILAFIAYDIYREEKLYKQGNDLIKRLEDLDG